MSQSYLWSYLVLLFHKWVDEVQLFFLVCLDGLSALLLFKYHILPCSLLWFKYYANVLANFDCGNKQWNVVGKLLNFMCESVALCWWNSLLPSLWPLQMSSWWCVLVLWEHKTEKTHWSSKKLWFHQNIYGWRPYGWLSLPLRPAAGDFWGSCRTSQVDPDEG